MHKPMYIMIDSMDTPGPCIPVDSPIHASELSHAIDLYYGYMTWSIQCIIHYSNHACMNHGITSLALAVVADMGSYTT